MRQRKLKGLEDKLRVYSGGVKIDPAVQKGRWNEFFQREQPIYLELGCGKGQFILSLSKAYPDRNFIAVEGNQSVMLRALQKAARFFCRFEPSELLSEDGSERPFEEIVQEGVFAVRNISEVKKKREGIEEYSGAEDDSGVERDTCPEHEDAVGGDAGSIYAVAPNLVFANMYVREITDVFAEDELSGIYLNFSDPWPKERHAKRRLTHTRYLKGYGRVLRQGSALEFKTDNEGLFRFSVEEFDLNGLDKEEYSENLHASEYESKNYMTEYEEKFSARGNPIYYCRIRY